MVASPISNFVKLYCKTHKSAGQNHLALWVQVGLSPLGIISGDKTDSVTPLLANDVAREGG